MLAGLLGLSACGLLAPARAMQEGTQSPAPWREAGLSDRQAVRHALARLGFGVRPGQVDEILSKGLAQWLDLQIQGGEDGRVEALLRERPFLRWPGEQLVRRLSIDPKSVQAAMQRGVVDAEALAGGKGILRQRDAQAALDRLLMSSGGARSGAMTSSEMVHELVLQKVVRATLSSQQLHETLADFWFDHFNVSAGKARVAAHLVQYERDVIRGHQWGTFRQLLGEVAHHPAMLHYLDNWRSRADGNRLTKFDFAMLVESTGPLSNPTLRQPVVRLLRWQEPAVRESLGLAGELGLNENYARELLELHTLGVNGGYDQWDVIDVARAFTGWTTLPLVGRYRQRLEGLFLETELVEELGFARQAEFVFRPDYHDAESKQILGQAFEEGGGIGEGERVLDLLAQHPSTARHVAQQLVQHLVADPPPERLIRQAAGALANTGGDLRVAVWSIVQSPDFWRTSTRPQRKSPLQFVVSALRVLGAEPVPHEMRPAQLSSALERLGQPLYRADPPTGFEPVEAIWFAAGPLFERSYFAFLLTHGQLPGWRIDQVGLRGSAPFTEPAEAISRAIDLVLPTIDEEARATIEQAFASEQVPPQRWFQRALWLVLCSPEFQIR